MRIGVIGGTGPLGRGLGLRLAVAGHDVVLGSRDADRAAAVAGDLGVDGVAGADNTSACADAKLVVVAVPYAAQTATLPALAGAVAGKPVICAVVPLAFDDRGPHPVPVAEGSAAEQCQALLPEARVVAGFQWVPAPMLLRRDAELAMDVPLCTDDDDAGATVAALCSDVAGLRGFVAGPLRLAASLEALTPLLLSTNRRYRAHTGVRFTGLPQPSASG